MMLISCQLKIKSNFPPWICKICPLPESPTLSFALPQIPGHTPYLSAPQVCRAGPCLGPLVLALSSARGTLVRFCMDITSCPFISFHLSPPPESHLGLPWRITSSPPALPQPLSTSFIIPWFEILLSICLLVFVSLLGLCTSAYVLMGSMLNTQ